MPDQKPDNAALLADVLKEIAELGERLSELQAEAAAYMASSVYH